MNGVKQQLEALDMQLDVEPEPLDVEVEEALAYLQRRDVEAAGPSEAGLAPADEGSDDAGLGGTSL